MALRVLLADESVTIKKVITLALQDYAAEVKTVSLGVDVIPVAKAFQPDIVLADILLQKKNGYEVSQEMKADTELARVPVVLMWSNFMELDKAKFGACKANASLEKPFDASQLRKLVQDLVPKTKSQGLSSFLVMPKVEKPAAPEKAKAGWNMESFEEMPKVQPGLKDGEEDFTQVSLSSISVPAPGDPPSFPSAPAELGSEPKEGDWKPLDLASFKLNLPANAEAGEIPVNFKEAEPTRTEAIHADAPIAVGPTGGVSGAQLSRAELETLLRSQSKEIIESIVWKIVPDMASNIIRAEIDRLLRESGR